VVALPSGVRSRVKTITTWEGDLETARAPQSVVLTLEDEADISRGDMIAAADARPQRASRIEATVVWMHAKPLRAGASYLLKHTTQTVRARVAELRSRIDVEHLDERAAEALDLNAIGQVVLETSRPLLADLYRENRITGSFILIDPADNATAGAGMIRALPDGAEGADGSHGALVILGDLRTLAGELEERLLEAGVLVVRTRVEERALLLPLAHAGAVVLAEGGEGGEMRITIFDRGATEIRESFAVEGAASIVEELRRAGVVAGEGLNQK
jgi:sulfate adenylyltransferase subunit 1